MNELLWNSTRGFWQIGVALHDFGDDLAQALSGKELRHYNHALLEGTEICFPILPWQLAYSMCGLPFNLTFIGFSSSACFLIPEFLWVLSPSLSWYTLLGGMPSALSALQSFMYWWLSNIYSQPDLLSELRPGQQLHIAYLLLCILQIQLV